MAKYFYNFAKYSHILLLLSKKSHLIAVILLKIIINQWNEKNIISFSFVSHAAICFNTIELTAEYAKDLGNPFRVILEKK